jgi:D-glycero-D-manno-heptose 1,7-bisphosphate phosphatase
LTSANLFICLNFECCREIWNYGMDRDIGLWCELTPAARTLRPALFLDRDGVIIADTGYVGRAEGLQMLEGVAAAIARCNALEVPIVVVTNQSGIARGLYDWDGFHAVQAGVAAHLTAAGAHLDAVLACAYHGDGSGPLRVDNHPWRKPNPGMILAAASGMNLDLAHSWIVGDRAHDLAAGAAAGLYGGTLIAGDEREQQAALALANSGFVVEIATSSAAAIAAVADRGRCAP